MNKLQCPLCQKAFHQPCMCPHCSEVYCLKCIKKYLEDFYFCPSCDRHIIDLVDCSRLINQVKEKIKESDFKKNKQSLLLPSQLCNQHNLPLKYHCITCKIDICSDCGLISQKHKGHSIKPIENTKPPKNMISQSQLKQIKHKVSQKLHFFQQEQKRYILQLELLKSQIKYNKTKIYEYYEQLILRLQKQTQILLKDIQERIHQCTKQLNEEMGIKEKIDSIERKSLKELFEQCYSPLAGNVQQPSETTLVQIPDKQLYKHLMQKNYIKPTQTSKVQKRKPSSRRNRNFLKKQHQEKKAQNILENQQYSESFSHTSLLFDKKIYELGIMKQIYPQYHNFSFQLDSITSRDEDTVYSPNFKVFGYEWRLKIYPKGNAQAYNQHLSVFLQLVNSPQALTSNLSRQYFFRLQLLNLNQAGKSVIKQYNSKFCVGECWGYAEFVPTNQVKDYLHDGKLLFVMGVKNVSYYDLCENMKKYITKLEGQTKILSELCENYYVGNNTSNHSIEDNSNAAHELGLDSSSSSISEQLDSISIASNLLNNIHHIIHQDQISSIISSIDDD